MVKRPIIRSFIHAYKGFRIALHEEKNLKIHVLIGLLVFCAALYFAFSFIELALVVVVISLVIASELLNSALERFSDIVKPRVSSYVERVKDIMAACVLVLSFNAIAVGILLFLPKIITRFF